MTEGTAPRSWRDIGDLKSLLDTESLLELLRASGVHVSHAHTDYLRIKQGESALVGVTLEAMTAANKPVQIQGYIRTHTVDRAEQIASKWHADRAVPTSIGPGVRLLDGGRSVLFLFPNDAEVRGLRFVADPDKLKRMLGNMECIGRGGWRVRGRKTLLEVVRYKPERRLILRARLGLKNDSTGERTERRVFMRFFTDGRGDAIHRLCVALHDGPLRGHVATPIGTTEEGRLLVEEDVGGCDLIESVVAGRGNATAVAGLLSALHATEVDGLPALETNVMLNRAEEALQNLVFVNPALKSLAEPIVAKLRVLEPKSPERVTVHGDCHLHQFLDTSRGIVMVDFERAASGPPMSDLGQLRAHAAILGLRDPAAENHVANFADDVLTAYLAEHPERKTEDLAFYVGCGLLDRALLPFRRLAEGWHEQCTEILALALSTVDGAESGAVASADRLDPAFHPEGAWEVAYPRTGDEWPGFVHAVDGEREYGLFTVSDGRFRACDLTNDARLPALREWAERGELRSYRVGRRAIISIAEGQQFVKIVRPGRASVIADHIRMIEKLGSEYDGFFPRVPSVLSIDDDRGVIVMQGVGGPSLHDVLIDPSSLSLEPLDYVARSLAAYHGVDVPADLVTYQAGRSLAVWAEFVAQHDEALAERCLTLASDVKKRSTPCLQQTKRLVHGDLHDLNILVQDGVVTLLDVDDLSAGDPLLDVGNLIAHLVLRALQSRAGADDGWAQAIRFVAAYKRGGGLVARDDVTAIVEASLLRLACVYRFRRAWCHLPQQLLDEVSVARLRLCAEGAH